jgi:hypothetical protein
MPLAGLVPGCSPALPQRSLYVGTAAVRSLSLSGHVPGRSAPAMGNKGGIRGRKLWPVAGLVGSRGLEPRSISDWHVPKDASHEAGRPLSTPGNTEGYKYSTPRQSGSGQGGGVMPPRKVKRVNPLLGHPEITLNYGKLRHTTLTCNKI